MLHMKRLNKTEYPIFGSFVSRQFPKDTFYIFILHIMKTEIRRRRTDESLHCHNIIYSQIQETIIGNSVYENQSDA